MKHIRKVSSFRADAFSDFLNDISRAWTDFVYAKKNETSV
jgi:hypothetical protein